MKTTSRPADAPRDQPRRITGRDKVPRSHSLANRHDARRWSRPSCALSAFQSGTTTTTPRATSECARGASTSRSFGPRPCHASTMPRGGPSACRDRETANSCTFAPPAHVRRQTRRGPAVHQSPRFPGWVNIVTPSFTRDRRTFTTSRLRHGMGVAHGRVGLAQGSSRGARRPPEVTMTTSSLQPHPSHGRYGLCKSKISDRI